MMMMIRTTMTRVVGIYACLAGSVVLEYLTKTKVGLDCGRIFKNHGDSI